ncbi:hypothetical protein LV89_04898 [Arcicella aurantiaca]|uniref:Uncharacterized protein n=1 Tax=Arcicella aurantiaca TaxID=591202 RepID=A0A316DHN8_9BACT|nr:hypothetical protein [Arcicella aurantiaca]PWK16123.1 hypothetical protein LV89_04898 [Arcicella aurantiaca]
MKIKLILFVIIIFCEKVHAQSTKNEKLEMEQKIVRSWVKYSVNAKDGSQLQDVGIVRKTASMLIFRKGGGCVLIFGNKALLSETCVEVLI